jgi:arylsulfatase A-like enzyme
MTLAAVLLLCAFPARGQAPDRPNIILIFADDLGYGDLGCYGAQRIRTPHLDRMAQQGVRLTSFYAQAVCGPSRAALMTGCYPIRVAEPRNIKNQHTILHPREITMAEALRDAGYATACIGKWHLGQHVKNGWDPATMPNGQGFDLFFGTPLFNGFTVHVEDQKFRSSLVRNSQVVVPSVQSWDTITEQYTQEALKFIQDHRGRPFFLYLSHNMPHIPLGAGASFKGRSSYGLYGDAVEEIDASTGRILDELQKLGLDDRTLVIFTSDNGPWIETTHGNDPTQAPLIPADHSGSAGALRGYKMTTWEGGLRVPCIARYPGRIRPGITSDAIATTMDLFPTLAKLAGAPLPADRTIDGRDIRPILWGEPDAQSPHETFYYYCYTHLQAVRSGPWKLVLPRPEHPAWTGFSGRFHGNGVAAPELYNVDDDLGETRNVASDHPEIVARLMERVEAARRDLGDYDRIGAGARFFDPGPQRPDLWTSTHAKD